MATKKNTILKLLIIIITHRIQVYKACARLSAFPPRLAPSLLPLTHLHRLLHADHGQGVVEAKLYVGCGQHLGGRGPGLVDVLWGGGGGGHTQATGLRLGWWLYS